MRREPLGPGAAFAVVLALVIVLGAVLLRPRGGPLAPPTPAAWFGERAGGAVHLDAPSR